MTTLYHGDCLEIMPTLEAGSVDMILCDLPYGFTQNKWDSPIDLPVLWQNYARLSNLIILFASDKFSARLISSKYDIHKYNLIWRKTTPTGHLNAKKQPLRTHEQVCVFYGEQPTYNPQKPQGIREK